MTRMLPSITPCGTLLTRNCEPSFTTRYQCISDRRSIQATIVQLFFRLNLQQYQNQKYKENRERRSSTESRGGQITLDEASTSWSVRVDPSHRPASQPRVSLSAEPRFNSELPQERVVSDLINPSLLTQSKGNSPQDPYVVPESPRATLEAVRCLTSHAYLASQLSIHRVNHRSSPRSTPVLVRLKSDVLQRRDVLPNVRRRE